MKNHYSVIILGGLLLTSFPAFSCDNTSCASSYLNEVEQYASLQNQHAIVAQQERIAYAKIRESRQKKVNEQLIREARANLILIINKAIAQGKSAEFIENAVKEAYESGSIKAKVSTLVEEPSASDPNALNSSSKLEESKMTEGAG